MTCTLLSRHTVRESSESTLSIENLRRGLYLVIARAVSTYGDEGYSSNHRNIGFHR